MVKNEKKELENHSNIADDADVDLHKSNTEFRIYYSLVLY